MADGSSSFGFLKVYGPLYFRLAEVAEQALALDPNTTLVKTRQLGEAFARHAAARAGLIADRRDGSESQIDLLRLLEQRGVVRDHIAETFHALRRAGNRAVHDFTGSRQDALEEDAGTEIDDEGDNDGADDEHGDLRAWLAGWVLTDLEGRAFVETDASPGIDASVLVRPKVGPAPTPTPDRAADVPAAPASTVAAAAAPASIDPPPSDYEIVAARLRVLAAQPGAARLEGWSAEAVELACDRVLPDGQRMLLKKMAEKLSGGVHDTERDVRLLRDHLDRGARVAVVDAFELLGGDRARCQALRNALLEHRT
jgi:hypothetical protein